MKNKIINVLSTSLLTISQLNLAYAWEAPVATEAPPQVKEAGLAPNLDASKAPTNDPYIGYQWALKNDRQSYVPTIGDLLFEEPVLSNPKIQIGWKNFDAQMKREVIVAVLDSGMYTTKGGPEDLRENLLPGRDFVNTGAIEDEIESIQEKIATETDEAQKKSLNEKLKQLQDRLASIGKIYDDKLGHGTHISGIIAAKINNGIGISGLSNKVKILPLRVFGEKETPKNDTKETDVKDVKASNDITPRIIKAIDYAIEKKADVLQLSLGWPRKEDSDKVHAAFKKASAAGIIIVAASGNDGHTAQIFPCAYKEVLCVGSISLDGSTSTFSNRGGHVDLMAPGQAIISTIPPTLPSLRFGARGYEIKNGTSQAAPFVSGAAAILRGIYPNESADQIKNRLRLGASKISEDATFGLLNIEKSASLHSTEIAFAQTKSLEDVVVDKNSLSFEFPLVVFSNLSSAPKVDVKSLNPDFKIVSVTKTSQSNSELTFTVKAKANSLRSNNTFGYEVSVNDGKQISQLTLKLKLNDLSRETLIVDNIEPVKKTGFLPITSAQNTFKIGFWSFITSEDKKSMTLYIWEKINDKLVEKSVVLESAESPLASFNVLQDDFDFDGSLDYLILTVRNPGTKDAALDYIYLDKDLKTLFRFETESVKAAPFFVGPKDLGLAKVRFPTKSGYLKTPVFKGTGVAPAYDSMMRFTNQNDVAKALTKPVSSEDYIAARGTPATETNPAIERLYYFEPQRLSNSSYIMRQRALTGHIAEAAIQRLIYEQKVISILALPKFAGLVSADEVTKALDTDSLTVLIGKNGLSDILSPLEKTLLFESNIRKDLNLIGMMPQTNAEVAQGNFNLLFSLGRGVNQDYYRFEISDLTSRFAAAKIIDLNYPQIDLKRNQMKDVIQIKSESIDTETSLIGVYTFTTARAALLRNDQIYGFNIELSDRKEAVATILRSFSLSRSSDFLNFIETTKNVRIKGTWYGKTVDEAAPVFRTTFLPGYSFSELFEGVLVSERQTPGVLIDSSDIFSNRIAIYTLDDDLKMRSSIERSIEIPNNCRARKKPFLNAKGFSSLAVICADRTEVEGSEPQFKVRVELVELK